VVDESSVIPEAGAVSIIYGQNQDGIFGGLSAIATPDQFWTQLFIHPPIP
jgi:hypothetical protein